MRKRIQASLSLLIALGTLIGTAGAAADFCTVIWQRDARSRQLERGTISQARAVIYLAERSAYMNFGVFPASASAFPHLLPGGYLWNTFTFAATEPYVQHAASPGAIGYAPISEQGGINTGAWVTTFGRVQNLITLGAGSGRDYLDAAPVMPSIEFEDSELE